jgi:Co/Zn/Cd efflux system component
MVCTDCTIKEPDTHNDSRWRRILWIALGVNAAMFMVEIAGGVIGGSKALQADALDFLGDAANYAISLGVAGMVLAWRARAALLKGVTVLVFGLYVLVSTLWALGNDTVPAAPLMGAVGFAALIANVGVAAMLYRYREGDANMRSVWICSRNDAISNVAVLAAAAGVFGTGTAWPDLLVAAIMAGLALWGGTQIVRQAIDELRPPASETIALHHRARLLVAAEMRAFDRAKSESEADNAWRALERAHIMSQPYLGLHLASHWQMLRFALAMRDGREALGQLFRLALAPLGALTGRIPVGNTGRADVSAFAPMPIPDDIEKAIREPRVAGVRETL